MRKDICTNYNSEINTEYDKFGSRLERCANDDEVVLQYSLHLSRLFNITNKYAKHEKTLATRGIDFGR